MNNVLTAEFPERSNNELQKAKLRLVNQMGLQEYINSYACHLCSELLPSQYIKKEVRRVTWKTIHEMQKNYQYN